MTDDAACVYLQHATADVERMVLGNKCDMNDKRQVSRERGEKVCAHRTTLQNYLPLSCSINSYFLLFFTQLAIDYGIKFLETSAKSSVNVEEVNYCH